MSEFTEVLARLSGGYYNSQAYNPATNPGGLAADGHVLNFPAALEDLGEVAGYLSTIETSLAQTNAALDQVNEAGLADIQARLDAITNSQGITNCHIDPVNGDDSRSGATLALSIKTWGRFCEVVQDAAAVQGYLYGDIIADTSEIIQDGVPYLALWGRDNTNAFVHRKITSVDATNSSAFPGGLRVFDRLGFYFNHIDFEVNTSRGAGLLDVRTCNVRGRFQSADFFRSGTGTAVVLYHLVASSGNIEFINHTVGAAGGYIITDVADGGNPNTGAFTSNITAL